MRALTGSKTLTWRKRHIAVGLVLFSSAVLAQSTPPRPPPITLAPRGTLVGGLVTVLQPVGTEVQFRISNLKCTGKIGYYAIPTSSPVYRESFQLILSALMASKELQVSSSSCPAQSPQPGASPRDPVGGRVLADFVYLVQD